MKDFVVKQLENFLDISDTLETPFKFFELSTEKEGVRIRATVWLKIALVSWEEVVQPGVLQKVLKELNEHQFVETELRETPTLVRLG